MDLVPGDEAITAGSRLKQEVKSTGGEPKPEGGALSLGRGDVEAALNITQDKMALRPEHLA